MSLNYVSGPASAVVDNTIVRWDSTTGRLVQGSTVVVSDIGELVQPSGATNGHRIYNTADQVTNTSYLELAWASNVAVLRTNASGSGTLRNLVLSAGPAGPGAASVSIGSGGGVVIAGGITTGLGSPALDVSNAGSSFGATSGAQYGIRFVTTVNQATGTGSFDALFINPTLTAVGSGGAALIRTQVAAANRFVVDSNGNVAACMSTAIPAGGTQGRGLNVSSTADFGVFFGSGAPSLTAAKGSLYLRSDGSGVNDRCYVNTDGGTTWTAVVTVG